MSITIGQHGLRFAFVPLYLRAQRDSGRWAYGEAPLPGHDDDGSIAFTLKNLAEQLGVTHEVMLKQASRGWMGEELADRYATALGYHVVDIWPDYFEMVEQWDQVEAERAEARRLRHNEYQRRHNQRRKEQRAAAALTAVG